MESSAHDSTAMSGSKFAYPFHLHKREQKIPKGTVVELKIGMRAGGVEYEAGESFRRRSLGVIRL